MTFGRCLLGYPDGIAADGAPSGANQLIGKVTAGEHFQVDCTKAVLTRWLPVKENTDVKRIAR